MCSSDLEKMVLLKYDEGTILSNDYMESQVAGHGVHKLVRRWKKVPRTRQGMRMYNLMRQKDGIFSNPLVQGKLDSVDVFLFL